jgi:glycine cleavage system H protein
MYPENYKYSKEHEWVSIDGDVATVGITSYAADALGDVVYLDLPSVGASTVYLKICGEIESTKSVSELYSPIDGEVVEVNDAVSANPEMVNSDPHGEGWLFKVKFSELSGELMSASDYQEMVG